jgi:hypothetical protein
MMTSKHYLITLENEKASRKETTNRKWDNRKQRQLTNKKKRILNKTNKVEVKL